MPNQVSKHKDHWVGGKCACPLDGKCIECGKPCNDHDLVADYHWCNECINRALDNDATGFKGE